ncbi:MAG: hypothetical protein ACTSU5_01060 [Promethearchaeota archaeon]
MDCKRAFFAFFTAGTAGVVLACVWAYFYYGSSLWAGRDAVWLVPAVLGAFVLYAAWGGVYARRLAGGRFHGLGTEMFWTRGRVTFAVVSLFLLSCGGTLLIGFVARREAARLAYGSTRALITDPSWLGDENRTARRESVTGAVADYDLEPRLGGGSPSADEGVDVDLLVKNCEDLGVNCYHFLVWHRSSDWDDFKAFVLAAERSATLASRNFTCWAYLVPPSEAHSKKSEPYGLDFVAWMGVVASFSADHPIVTAVCIDDFYSSPENRALFTRDYLEQMRVAADQHDPSLALVTVLYWCDVNPGEQVAAWERAAALAPHIDGILYPYLDQSERPANHEHTASVGAELTRVRELYPGIPVLLDVYASTHSACEELPDAAYVGALLDAARISGDGVALYCGPKRAWDGTFPAWNGGMADPAAVFETARAKFSSWAGTPWPSRA